jgi:iron(III) transport system substrate-binding protein
MRIIANKSTPGRRSTFLLAAAVAILPFLAAGGVSAQQQTSPATASSWDAVPAAARQEGKVTVYASTSRPVLDQAIAAFNKQYPDIKFDVLEGAVGDLTARIDQEIASHQPIADMYLLSDLQWPADINKRGQLVKLAGPAAQKWPDKFRIGDSYTISINAAGIVVNTDLVSKPVTGYEDILRDEFAGRVGVQQWTRFIQPGFWAYLDTRYPGLLDKLAARKPAIYRNSEAGSSSVASGELFATMFSTPTVPLNLKAQGAPIAFVIPDKPFGVPIAMGVLAQSTHPNASELFMNFILSEEGQHLWNPQGSGQASPLGFGDFDPATVEVWDTNKWTEDQIKASGDLWNKRFATH